MIDLAITPLRPARLADQANELVALVRVTAPPAPPGAAARPPLSLVLVLDRSGSMAGAPLREARRAAAQVVERLRADDRVAVVAFDSVAEVMRRGGPRGDGRDALDAIARIVQGGTTALHDGWLLGMEQAIAMRAPRMAARVLLLSDGAANAGLTDPDALAADCARMAAHGVATSTCGLGHHFNEHLMTAMARSGEGNAYYGATAEDLADPFAEEFDLLDNLCARRLRLRLTPGPGVAIRVLNRHPEAEGEICLPDLAHDGEAWALVRLRFDERGEEPGDRLLLTATLRHEAAGGEAGSAGPVHLRLPSLPARAFGALAEDETVRARLVELHAADLQDQARVAARRHDWDEVGRLLREAETDAGSNPWVATSIATLSDLAGLREVEGFSKEAMYTARKMRTRLAARQPDRETDWNAGAESGKASYLRRKTAQGKRMPPG